MPGTTSPLGFPYPVDGDTLHDAITVLPQQFAKAVNDYMAALSAVAATPWANLSLNSGWGGTVQYARRAGMVTIAVAVDKSTFAKGDIIGQMPAGFRPTVNLYPLGAYAASPRGIYLSGTDAGLRVDDSAAYTGGIRAVFSYAV